jgi:hypothetical protein
MVTPRNFTAIMALALIFAMPAMADAVFQTGNHHQQGEQNILLHTNQTGSTINDFTNQSNTLVEFSSTTNTLHGKGGQSDIDDAGGALLHNLTFTIPGDTFKAFIWNPFKPKVNGDLIVTAVTNDGTFNFTYGDKHGDNFLTILAVNGEVLESVTINSASGFQDLKQPRVAGIDPIATTPEPSSMLLLGSGMAGLAGFLRRKMR